VDTERWANGAWDVTSNTTLTTMLACWITQPDRCVDLDRRKPTVLEDGVVGALVLVLKNSPLQFNLERFYKHYGGYSERW